MQRGSADRLLVMYRPRKGDRVNAIQPAKALLIAAVIGLGLSGGFAAAAFLPGGSAPAAVSQIWDQTVGQMFGNGLGEKGSYITAAATYIGITEAQLRTKRRAGQTLAQIANATAGKSRDGLLNALVADAPAKIDAAQKAGTITADQATQLKANLSTRLAQLVDNTGPFPGRRGR